jgi:hypothetical protein
MDPNEFKAYCLAAARAAVAAFTTVERVAEATGERVVVLRDGCPSWVRDAVHSAHGDHMPDDWTFSACYGAAVDAEEAIDYADADTLAEAGDGFEPTEWCDDRIHEHAENAAIYYAENRRAFTFSPVVRDYDDDNAAPGPGGADAAMAVAHSRAVVACYEVMLAAVLEYAAERMSRDAEDARRDAEAAAACEPGVDGGTL